MISHHSYSLSFFFQAFFLLATPFLGQNLSFGQKANIQPRMHELSLQLFSLHQIIGEPYTDFGGLSFGTEHISGLQYTLHCCPRQGFRIGAQRRLGGFIKHSSSGEAYELIQRSTDFLLGYERKFPMGRTQLFWGADLLYSQASIGFQQIKREPGVLHGAVTRHHMGMSALGGAGFFFTSALSLSAEVKLGYLQPFDETTLFDNMPFSFLENGELFFQTVISFNVHLFDLNLEEEQPE